MQTFQYSGQSYDFCVLCIVADVNNAIKFQHETLIGFQVTAQKHNAKLWPSISKHQSSKNMQSRITNLLFCRSSDVVNNPVKFHEAILIGCQVTGGTPLVDYNAKYAIYKLCGHEWNANSSIFRFKRP